MTPLYTFANARQYYFREQIARIDREQREFGGRSLDDYDLDDFRRLYAIATSQAVEWRRQINNRYDRWRKTWVQL